MDRFFQWNWWLISKILYSKIIHLVLLNIELHKYQIALGKGLLRSVLCKEENILALIPVDIAINSLVVVPWYIAKIKY